MKKLILFLFTLFTLSVSAQAHDEICVERFDTVVVNVPAVIRCEYSKEYSIAVKGDNHYNYTIVNGTLTINSKFRSEEIDKLNPDSLYLIIKHPKPARLISTLKYPKSFKTYKIKSGNQN